MNLSNFISSHFWDTENRKFVNFARYFSLASIIIGTLALILSLSVLDGYDKELRKNAIKFSAHINLQNFNRGKINNFPLVETKLKENFPDIVQIQPIIQSEALIQSPNQVEGIFLRGVDTNYNFSVFSSDLKQGNFNLQKDNSIIIGQRLATKLNVQVGDLVTIFGVRTVDSLTNIKYKAGKFTITGIFESNMAQYDDIIAYINISSARNLFGYSKNEISNFEIMLDDINKSSLIAHRIEKKLGYPFYALTVYDLHRSIFAWIDLQKEPIPIVLGLIIIIAAFNVITTLFILVVEKLKSIAILRALGVNQKVIISIFIKLGVKLGLFGSLIGSALTFLFCILQKNYSLIKLNGNIYFLDILPVQIIGWHYVIVILIATSLSFIATLIPAYIASRINPIQALRFK
jgi:lipoprotein-releasing system permease protein